MGAGTVTVTVCASRGRHHVSAMNVGSPIQGPLEVGQLPERAMGPDRPRGQALCPRVAVRLALVQVSTW